MSEKKILLLVSFLEPWSMGSGMGAPSLFETMRGYVAAGWHVHYITASKRALGGGSHEHDINIEFDGVTVHRFDLPAPLHRLGARLQGKFDRVYLYPKYAALAVQGLLKTINPKLIYAYEEGAVLALDRVQRSQSLPCPLVHRFQGTILGSQFNYWPTRIRKFETWRALTKRADMYIMTDDGTMGDRALSAINTHVNSNNLYFKRNGIDLGIADSSLDRQSALGRFDITPDQFSLLMVSRLAGWKRVDRGIDLIAALKNKHPNLRLIIVGDGECREQLESRSRSLGLDEEIRFLGSQSRPTVAMLMNLCDAFLSLYDVSNCGNPLFEALLCGRPIITLNNGTTSEVIKHRSNGILVEPDDNDSLKHAISELVDVPELAAELSGGALSWAAENLQSWEARLQSEVDWVDSNI